jgi:tRNA nucleotidyltransferase (CCA-adding enzyme)
MHMPQRPMQGPIVARDSRRQVLQLWESLDPCRWPLPPTALPPGTALVGGAVRDALLHRLGERPDLDFIVADDAIALTRSLARRLGGTAVVLDAERSIARLVIDGWTIDLARCAGGSLRADLGRRDFTVNAIALPLQPATAAPVDPHGGLDDLGRRRLVAISEANLLEDPLRLLRGIRLSVELDFSIEPQTWRWIGTHRARLAAVAGERVMAELERIAAAPEGQRGLRRVMEVGLLECFGAERGDGGVGSDGPLLDQLTSSRAALLGLSAEEIAWALPLARLALVVEKRLLRRLHASRRLQDRCGRIHSWWKELRGTSAGPPELGSLSEERRLALHRSLEQDLPALLLLLGPREDHAALQRWRDPGDPLFHPRCPLDGHRLQSSLALAPGRDLGRLMQHLTRERAFGRLPAGEASGAGTVTHVPPEVLAVARRWLEGEGMRHDGQ